MSSSRREPADSHISDEIIGFHAQQAVASGGDNASPSWTSDPLTVPASPPPSPPAPPSTPPRATDKVAPKLVFKQEGRQRVLRQGGSIVLGLRPDERCQVTITGKVVVPGKDVSLKKTTRSLNADKLTTIRLKLSGKALKAVKRTWRHHRIPAAQLRILAKDAAGNATKTSRRILLLP